MGITARADAERVLAVPAVPQWLASADAATPRSFCFDCCCAPFQVGEEEKGNGNGQGGEQEEIIKSVGLNTSGVLPHASQSRKGTVPYNKNKMNQDRAFVHFGILGDPQMSAWGVADGHGEFGHHVAAFVQSKLPECLAAQGGELRAQPEKAMTDAVRRLCDELTDTNINVAFSGSTLCFGLRVQTPPNANGGSGGSAAAAGSDMLYVANVGDSRCVMCRQGPNGQPIAIPLSTDQKPERADEKARILAHGGRVEPLPGPPGECGPARVWLAEADVPGLAMSRSIGDEVSQTVGVTSVPEITKHTITEDDVFAVWASDGVWEFLDDQTVIKLLWKHKDNLQEAANQLADESTKQWRKEEEVIDDIVRTHEITCKI